MQELNLELDGEMFNFQIPESWAEVSVEQFSNIWKIEKEGRTDIDISVDVVSSLTGIEEDIIYMMRPDDFGTVAKTIEFTNKDVEGEEVDSITIGEDEYFLKKDFESLTMGEVISLEILIEKADGNLAKVMTEMLCIFLRKKKGDDLETFKKSFMERAEIFKDVKITQVNDLFLFFSDGETSSEDSMKESSESQK